MTTDYRQFLEAKRPPTVMMGLPCTIDDVPETLTDGRPLKPHQRACIAWAIYGGRRALFQKFGLGKSIQQLLICRLMLEKLEAGERPADMPKRQRLTGRALIVAPLGVRQEFRRDAGMVGVDLHIVRETAEVKAPGVYLSHYEAVRDGKIDISLFDIVSLDEASVLRSYGSKTFQTFLPLFDGTPFRFVATATPSPNRYKELIHYAGFLGIMDTGLALTRFFQRNSEKANDLTLYPHKEDEFWQWLNSWAVFLQKPSDLGFSDDGYSLPPLDVNWHSIQVDLRAETGTDDRGQGLLIRNPAMGLSQAAREKRLSLSPRIAKVVELVEASPDKHFIIWHDLESEREALEAALPGIITIHGATDLDEREARIAKFADGHARLIALKPSMYGSGANLQRHCHRAIYCGVGFKFNDFIQSCHRIHRFGQEHQVRLDMIYAETESEVKRELEAKWSRHDDLAATMSEIIRTNGLGALSGPLIERSIGCERKQVAGKGWRLVHNDSVIECNQMDSETVDLVVTSIPFGNQYEYSPSYNDMGHTDDAAHFFTQMDYLTPALMQVLKPGRLACVHVKDRIRFGNVTGEGVPTVEPFSDLTVAHFISHGWQFMGRITVVTDVVRENNQTYRLSYGEMLKDGSKMGVGMPEYVLLFRRPQTDRTRGYADIPVAKSAADYSLARWQIDAHAFWRSSGKRFLTAAEMSELPTSLLPRTFTAETAETIYDFDQHKALGEAMASRPGSDSRGSLPKTFMAIAPASPNPDVWTDITRMRTLNLDQSMGGREKHVCPFQLDIVDRLIERYSIKGERVYDPFAGIGTVPVRALELGREGWGSELCEQYWRDSVRYCKAAEDRLAIPTLFDLLDVA